MSEYDLKKVDHSAYKLDKYITILQVKYGYSRKQAKSEIARRMVEFAANQIETNGGGINK